MDQICLQGTYCSVICTNHISLFKVSIFITWEILYFVLGAFCRDFKPLSAKFSIYDSRVNGEKYSNHDVSQLTRIESTGYDWNWCTSVCQCLFFTCRPNKSTTCRWSCNWNNCFFVGLTKLQLDNCDEFWFQRYIICYRDALGGFAPFQPANAQGCW
jgi:hypothetical protein